MATQAKFLSPKTIVQLIIVVVIMPLMPMLISGVWNWWGAWAWAIVSLFGFILSRGLASRRHPDIMQERSRSMELKDTKPWDKFLAPAMALGSFVILIVAGFDKLNHWTLPFPTAIKIAALVVIILGYVLGTWAMLENKFFSGVVRIQKDRDHHVVSTGPYRFIRHPGYAGTLWAYLAMPILLDSLPALIPSLLLLGVTIARTALEDRTLQAELPGYADFTKKTRYRLFPGIW